MGRGETMKLSTKGRYGTRALLDIALHQDGEPVPLKEIAQRQQISLAYLEHLISPLVSGGIIRSTRGIGGGVSLAKSPEAIKLSEVLVLLEGSIAPAQCVNNPQACTRSSFCVTRDVWIELKQAMDGVLEATTLQELATRQNLKGQPMYDI
ncbi:RrF2 family transcriptional regulator [Chloroflexota bacterium]